MFGKSFLKRSGQERLEELRRLEEKGQGEEEGEEEASLQKEKGAFGDKTLRKGMEGSIEKEGNRIIMQNEAEGKACKRGGTCSHEHFKAALEEPLGVAADLSSESKSEMSPH